ncbi:MAG: 23S rRNA pseudouridine(1911/1915/1917) synthase RluD [Acidiferrobacterales bacterium]|nr:23S rRNA pseudouridine(1911/1915/1917) synthase RluD [Acidiferrobacterales bacterium]
MTSDTPESNLVAFCLLEDVAGNRLDQTLASVLPEISRSQIQRWIDEGRVQLGGKVPNQRLRLQGREVIEMQFDTSTSTKSEPQAIPLDIVYQDDQILVINKPAGLVVHPGAGNPDLTLVNGLLHFDPSLAELPRAGVVHRLDKDTSGLLVVARNEPARLNLIDQLSKRSVHREYLALVNGRLIAGGTVNAPIGRSPGDRRRMTVTPGGKTAITHYRVGERFRSHTLLRVTLETGRTHQIRVHMAYIRHPIVGDPVYGGRAFNPKGASPELLDCLRGFHRQALHASRLGLVHPATGEQLEWERPMPEDMSHLVEMMRQDTPE